MSDEKKIVILGVDDDKTNMMLLERLIKMYPNVERFEKAYNGKEAIETIKDKGDINVVLLDVHMPEMNGIEFLKARQKDEVLNQIPIIMLTTDESKKNEAFDLGATDFLTKPITNKKLLHDKLDLMREIC